MAKNFKAPMLSIVLAEKDSDVPTRVQLLRVGRYHDPRYGEFKIDKQYLLSMKTNFDKCVLKIDPAIDYAHESNQVAAGWIKGLEIENDGTELWADPVEWTKNGSRVLSEKEFRYLSADFTDDYIDNETLTHYGPTLKGAGLTNRPVVKGMDPAVQLQEGKDDMATLAELEAQNKTLTETLTALTKRLDDMAAAAPKVKPEDAAGKGDDDGDEDDDGDMSADEVKKALAAMTAKCAEYEKKFGKLEAEKAAAEKASKFDKKLAEGKVCEAQREAFMAGDMVQFAELAQPINLSAKGHGGTEAPKGGTVDERITALAQTHVDAKTVKTLSEGYSKVLRENEALRIEKYGK